ncbi:MAG TPA: extracellular solute-binding protein [Spirochaetia bacterium]|nr:extracellular solute-binding protein [Spirochaetia bacterium]
MRKTLCFAAAVLVIAATGSFANGQSEGTSGSSSSSSNTKVTLSLYNYVDVTSPDYVVFQQLLTGFQQKYPDITLNVQNLFNEPYHQKLQAMAVAGEIPDLVYLWPSARTGYVTSRGLVKDLTSYLGSNKADFQPSAVAAQGPNGQLWELPQAASTATTVVYTNNALLQKLGLSYPKTLADLVAQSAKIRAAGLVPIAMADKDGWQTESCLLSTLVGRLGGNAWIVNANAKSAGASFTDPQFVDAVGIVKQMSDAKLFPQGITTMDYGQALQLFEQQKAVYMIDGDWRVSQMEKDLSPDVQKSISLNTFPTIPNQVAGDTISNIPSTGYGMNAKLSGPKADAAWKWIWFVAGPDGAAIHLKTGLIPAYQKLDVAQFNLGILTSKLVSFYKDVAGTQTVLDGIMDPKVIGILNPDLQVLMLGQKDPNQVAQDVANWYKQN